MLSDSLFKASLYPPPTFLRLLSFHHGLNLVMISNILKWPIFGDCAEWEEGEVASHLGALIKFGDTG